MTINLTNSTLLKTQAYINGQWVKGDNNDTFDVLNPATGEVLTSVASLGVDETRRAIEVSPQSVAPMARKACQRTRPIITPLV